MQALPLFGEPEMRRSARFSPCRRWRYELRRQWKDGPALIVVGLNPSTADEYVDDPTIRRCMGFAEREGCGTLVMLNIFGWRSTDPRGLKETKDPVGPGNREAFSQCVADAKAVVCAWGTHGHYLGQDRIALDWIREDGARPMRLGGLTKHSFPRHPLYLSKSAPLEPFE